MQKLRFRPYHHSALPSEPNSLIFPVRGLLPLCVLRVPDAETADLILFTATIAA